MHQHTRATHSKAQRTQRRARRTHPSLDGLEGEDAVGGEAVAGDADLHGAGLLHLRRAVLRLGGANGQLPFRGTGRPRYPLNDERNGEQQQQQLAACCERYRRDVIARGRGSYFFLLNLIRRKKLRKYEGSDGYLGAHRLPQT